MEKVAIHIAILVVSLILFSKTNKIVVGNLIYFIMQQYKLRKVIKRKFKELKPESTNSEDKGKVSNFNRGIFKERPTVNDEVLEEKIKIIEELNPHLFKDFAKYLLMCSAVIPLNLYLVLVVYNQVTINYSEILLYGVLVLGIVVAIISLFMRKWLVLVMLSIAILNKSVFLGALIIATFIEFKKKIKPTLKN